MAAELDRLMRHSRITVILILLAVSNQRLAPAAETDVPLSESLREVTQKFCLDCHSGNDPAGSFQLDRLTDRPLAGNSDDWERVVHKLRSRQMPPADAARPSEKQYAEMTQHLVTQLDELAILKIRPGRTESLRRLTRTEYRNAVRDLLAVEIDVDTLLPKDESSRGFDNITVGELSPTLLNRYITAAQRVARLAVGSTGQSPGGETFRIRPDLTQEDHVEGLPAGTRGGIVIPLMFPQDGQYEIEIRLTRDRNEEVEGLHGEHSLEILLDRNVSRTFTVSPPQDRDFSQVDAHLKARIPVSAGVHQLGVTFVRSSLSLLETKRQPYPARFNMHRHPRSSPAVFQVSVTGPFDATGPGETASRRRIFFCQPASEDDAAPCAEQILRSIMRRAYRRPLTDDDFEQPMRFFRQAFEESGFEAGIEAALTSVLVNPGFLFRIETDPEGTAPNEPWHVSQAELASRLSFFLWSSLPDDELLDLAVSGRLREPGVLEQQVRRMLTDERSQSLVTNFADQWLHLRNLDSITPDMRLFPDFDDNLRQAMRRETELFFESIIREDRPVTDLLRSDDTFLNERLARHYGIPHVQGSRFRRVTLASDSHRGGLLRQASILTVTSYATRTSPVIRGNWILTNLLSAPPPPPPGNVPALKDRTILDNLPIRERLAQHRADPNCASCHQLMDPIGFALENYDAIGRWREIDGEHPVDALGGILGGSEFVGVEGLEDHLLRHPELFVSALSEKLMTYALGRGVESFDAPAIRRIVRDAEQSDYRFSSVVTGIVRSVPFQMRSAE
ncbi:MAG: DUF1592 domain-containing protein [Planctomycetaceae bacterium]|nr:DUF1592 domain-containing protein [Planctomycetaceae bacterium]